MKPPESHADLLDRPLFAHLATVRADGAPQVNPMWFLWDPALNRVRLTHTRTRHNYRYLQSEPRVALCMTDPADQYRYLQVRGVVERVDQDPDGEFYNVLCERYRGHRIEVKDKDVRVILTIRPTAYKTR